MEKKKVIDSGDICLKESVLDLLKEISEIKPQTTFTKDQEEEFLKDAVVIFEYLKSGINIQSSEILINNGEIPFSSLEKIFKNFLVKSWKDKIRTYTFQVYKSDEGKTVKIYEFQKNEKKNLAGISNILLESEFVSFKSNMLFINPGSSENRESLTKLQLKKIIDYALKNNIIVFYDATANPKNKDKEKIKSIYEIENAKKIALEFKRFSSIDDNKISCGYIVIPECLMFPGEGSKEYNISTIKKILEEDMKKGRVSEKSLKNLFLAMLVYNFF